MYNGNRFSIYDSEEKTVLEMLDKFGGVASDIITNLDSKTDKQGDHQGTWQGLSKPTLSEEGMRATVELLQKKVDVNLLEFGAKINDNTFDNKQCFIQALEYMKTNKISVLKLPNGTIHTSPINFKEFNEIEIIGSMSSYYPDRANTNVTTIKFITKGEVGLQFSDTVFPKTYPSSISCKLKNLKIDGNNLVNVGVNGDFDFIMDNVAVVNCVLDGIQLESASYPVKLYKVFSAYNGGNGLTVKRGITTVYNLLDCEFSRNNGYGLYIKNGASATINNLVIQSNITGGIYIEKQKDDGQLNYLQDIYFNNLYIEHNGLSNTNQYALIIDSVDDSKSGSIYFNGFKINKSPNGKTMKINNSNDVHFSNGKFNSGDVIEYGPNIGLIEYNSPTSPIFTNILPSNTNVIKKSVDKNGYYIDKGVFAERGRLRVIDYKLSTLASWGTQNAVPLLSSAFNDNSTLFLTQGSVLRMRGEKVNKTGSSGKITVTLISKAIDGTGGETILCSYDWLNISTTMDIAFNPLDFNIPVGRVYLKVESKGHNDGGDSNYVFSIYAEV